MSGLDLTVEGNTLLVQATLTRTINDGQVALMRFDGFDGDILIDRKIAVVTSPKAKDQVLRQSDAL